ncbi:RHS repeat-associated core domain-containing protein, partial [uncultured Imperialibacter sp.]|uniref:RHS repeat-associated core domain-containing protein n=1 Tax=uncultured Imperialibacter sp. TaxID=1672639 RepID=UPI0030D7AC48
EVQSDDYYPFGLAFNSYQSGLKNDYLYNDGAERQDDLDLNIDLTKYRAYDPAIARWWQVDPKADFEDLVSWSPYNYSYNNPIRWNDPDGDCIPCQISGLVTATTATVSKYVEIGKQGVAPAQRLSSGTSGSVPSQAGMDSRTSATMRTIGTVNDINTVAQTGKQLSQEIVKDSGSTMNTTGDVIATAGLVVNAIPGGQVIGTGMVGLGEGMSAAGAIMEAVVDASNGNYSNAVGTALIEGTTGAASGAVNKLKGSGAIDNLSQSILLGINKAVEQIGYFINGEVDKQNQPKVEGEIK